MTPGSGPVTAIYGPSPRKTGIKSWGRRLERAVWEWSHRWVVEIPPGHQNRRERRRQAALIGRAMKKAAAGG